ncbi:hypothetical protein Scep_026625 [Stephania cephalantha]|uniref:Embryonic flower 2 n=1 Tax=Stephania cephalantha TaxID=152367 RepID=A0AAP0EKJ1_9MAGN
MPGLPLVPRENTNSGCNCSHARNLDQMCRQDSRVHLSAEEASAAEESLSAYCKPVELYNILQRRALQNPSILQRCLFYKIQEKGRRRIRMSISLAGTVINGVQAQSILPLYVLLARPVSDITVSRHSAVYCLIRASILTASSDFERKDCIEANFILPEINKLSAETKAGKLTILLVSCGERKNTFRERNLHSDRTDEITFPSNVGGYCLWGTLPMESFYCSWEKCVNLTSGHKVEMQSTIELQSCFLEPSCLDEGNYMSFQIPDNPGTMQVQVYISAQEVGAREKSPYNSYAYENFSASSLAQIMRLRTGNVIFNYKYYNNTLQKTEVTEDFSCPFCLVQCASFKGLRYHLCASHDLFNFECWVTEEYQAVNVSVKTDAWRYEIVADGIDPRLQTFIFCAKPRKRRKSKNLFQSATNVHPHVLKSDSPEVAMEGFVGSFFERDTDACSSKEKEKAPNTFLSENILENARRDGESNGFDSSSVAEFLERVASSTNMTGVSTATAQSSAGPECVQNVSGNNLAPPSMLQFAKTRKLSIERSDPRNRLLLQKRQFFHSHRAQPMAMEQVTSDRDSEDEVDDDIADFEDRRMLDDFVDVTKDEKQIMHLWNSFVRKQRVLADGHIPWACEAFSRLHGQDLVQAPALIWCWRLLMIKLWNHSLLDAHTMDNCNKILERYQIEISNPKQN